VSLKAIPLLQAFSSAIFRIYGTWHGPYTSAELLVRGIVKGMTGKKSYQGKVLFLKNKT